MIRLCKEIFDVAKATMTNAIASSSCRFGFVSRIMKHQRYMSKSRVKSKRSSVKCINGGGVLEFELTS